MLLGLVAFWRWLGEPQKISETRDRLGRLAEFLFMTSLLIGFCSRELEALWNWFRSFRW
jgi:hypothetical protein